MKKTIAVCDSNERYAMMLSDAIRGRIGEIFKVITFTETDVLSTYALAEGVCQLVISSTSAEELKQTEGIDDLIFLGNEQESSDNDRCMISRYQCCTNIVSAIMDHLAERDLIMPEGIGNGKKLKVIGVYSPVKRCLQTTFSLALGEQLGVSSRVLYMNFEPFSGFEGLEMEKGDTGREYDITDLLYYFDCARDKLPMKLSAMVRTINGMDFLPPTASYFDTERSGEKWVELFKAIEKSSLYDYLILDLSEAVQGLLSILMYCTKIFTIIRNDRIACAKVNDYEKWILQHEAGEVVAKTVKCELPIFHDIPEGFEMLTHGELAGFIRTLIAGEAA